MKVLKFGGTSVGTAESLRLVKDIVEQNSNTNRLAVVVSAFSGVTNILQNIGELALKWEEGKGKELLKSCEERHLQMITSLIDIDKQSSVISKIKQSFNELESILESVNVLNELSEETQDKIVSYGEFFSTTIILAYFLSQKLDVVYKDSRDIIITTDTKGSVHYNITNDLCAKYFDEHTNKIILLSGFIARTNKNKPTTLGRGGSDFTASIIAAAVGAKELEIWTDVSGIYTANPKLVKQAQPVEHLSYLEAMELSHFGAKVLYPPTILPIMKKGIPLYIKNTFRSQDKGTLIDGSSADKTIYVKGITSINNIATITLEGSGMIGVAGISKRFFEALAKENINIVLITQASSEYSICIAVNQNDVYGAKKVIDSAFEKEIREEKINSCVIKRDLSILAIVGDSMQNFQGVSGKVFSTLGRNNVNVYAIAQGASERNISVVIDTGDVRKGLNCLHEVFFQDNIKLVNLFVAGTGNVGKNFIEQVRNQKRHLKETLKLNIRIVAISNSRKMLFDAEGIALNNWSEEVNNKGKLADKNKFYENVKALNLRNSIFVDITASADISDIYAKYLENSIAVVACNKIACSSKFENYKHLKSLSRKYDAPLQFETNVGAALPIIDTLKNLIASGDEINEIHAVLSGSLNFVFNNFDGSRSFCEIVKQAREEGYTEPDPKIDLSGVDVARKILILVRESGCEMDINDIQNNSFLPENCINAKTVEQFFKELQTSELYFQEMLRNAKKNNCRLKYVATFKDGKAEVGIQEISSDHPFYDLKGKDNIVLFSTKRYDDQPLLIKGAGAGAEVTASGIFADVIRASNR